MSGQAGEAGKERAEWLDGGERTVAFVDILGFSEEVKKMTNPEEFRKVTMALLGGSAAAVHADTEDDLSSHFARQEGKELYGMDLRASFFSDCAYVSARGVEGADRVMSVVLGYAGYLLVRGFFVRGGIALGPASHPEGIAAVGPAALDAYQMEQKAAVYPRIVVEDAVAESLFAIDQEPNATATIRRGEDGLYFVDVLTTLGLRDDGYAVLRQAEKLIMERLEDHRSLDIDAKWRWLAAQYNRALRSIGRKGKQVPSPIERPDVAKLPDAL